MFSGRQSFVGFFTVSYVEQNQLVSPQKQSDLRGFAGELMTIMKLHEQQEI